MACSLSIKVWEPAETAKVFQSWLLLSNELRRSGAIRSGSDATDVAGAAAFFIVVSIFDAARATGCAMHRNTCPPLSARLIEQTRFASSWATLRQGVQWGCLSVSALTGHPKPRLDGLPSMPWWVWLGGFAGATYVTTVFTAIPAIGAATTVGLTVAGQQIASVLVDRYGWLRLPQRAAHRRRHPSSGRRHRQADVGRERTNKRRPSSLHQSGEILSALPWDQTSARPIAIIRASRNLHRAQIGFALTLIGTLLAEMFASQRGLGFLLMNAIGLHNVDLIMALTFILVAFAATVSSVLLFLDRRLHSRS